MERCLGTLEQKWRISSGLFPFLFLVFFGSESGCAGLDNIFDVRPIAKSTFAEVGFLMFPGSILFVFSVVALEIGLKFVDFSS